MNYERYTKQLMEAMDMAADYAVSMRYDYVGTEHILLGLVTVEDSVACTVLKNRNIDRDGILDRMDYSPNTDTRRKARLQLSPRAGEILVEAYEEAVRCNEEKVGTEHVLMAMIRNGNCAANALLSKYDLDIRKLYLDVLYAIGEDPAKFRDVLRRGEGGEIPTPTVDKFGRDFTELAIQGRLEPVVGREEEIERIIQILSRKTKNNPCLVGEAGVGKTAIVEGLARKMSIGDVPDTIAGKRLVSLELSGVVAGTKYRGEFEERIQNIIKEVSQSESIILFIDEIHTIIGAGGAEGALDASNILKPALARGEIQLIGATTMNEYRKHIEKDPALERRFQPVEVVEPSEEDTVAMLEGVVAGYEQHHRVSISHDAILAAVKLSARYINDRYLPDKAIDLMDEAAARANLNKGRIPKNITQNEAQIMELEADKENAIKEGDFQKVQEICKKQESTKKRVTKQREKWMEEKQDHRIVVTEDDIAELVSSWTKIPVARIAESESKRLLKLESELHKRVVGQDQAVEAVSRAIRRGRVGIKDPHRPIGSFLFLGPTGVGKTELSKALAETVFGSEDSIIRVDMSEYMEKHSVSKLIGSPPGYVGYEEGGQLSEKIRRHPYSVVLFDEVEKAHPDVFNMLLQVLDDGFLTDAHGRKVSFRNTILIMTSNVGASRIVDPKQLGFGGKPDDGKDYEAMKQAVMEEMKQIFRPEFINRIDEIIVFHPLSREEVTKIVGIMIRQMSKRILASMDIRIKVTAGARELLAKESYDKKFGARPLRRNIQNKVEDELSTMILAGEIKEGDEVTVSVSGKVIKITGKRT